MPTTSSRMEILHQSNRGRPAPMAAEISSRSLDSIRSGFACGIRQSERFGTDRFSGEWALRVTA